MLTVSKGAENFLYCTWGHYEHKHRKWHWRNNFITKKESKRNKNNATFQSLDVSLRSGVLCLVMSSQPYCCLACCCSGGGLVQSGPVWSMAWWVKAALPSFLLLHHFALKRNKLLCVLHFPKYSCYATKVWKHPGACRSTQLCLSACINLFVILFVVSLYLCLNAWHILDEQLISFDRLHAHTSTQPIYFVLTRLSAVQFYEWASCERLAEAAHWVKGVNLHSWNGRTVLSSEPNLKKPFSRSHSIWYQKRKNPTAF